MLITNHLEKRKKIISAFLASFMVAFVFAAVLPKVFAYTAYYVSDASVTLDGENDGEVTIYLKTPITDDISNVQGIFQTREREDSPNFVLTALTPAAGISPMSNVVSDGNILWQDLVNTVVIQADGAIWSATYTVDKDTPAGNVTLCLRGARIGSESNGWNAPSYGDLCGTVTVTRNDEPAEKPSQVVTFRDGEGNPITEITKHYGDDDFEVTREVTTGDGLIFDYHPDDDGSGSIAHTYPTGDMVGVGIPGDVDICAWVAETDNYAETKVCYTVHVLKRPLDIVGAVIEDKTFDGTTDATVTSVSFEDRSLNAEDYNATASFDEADAGENRAVHVSVQLTGEAADYYVLNASNYNTTKTILPYGLVVGNAELIGSGTYGYNPDGVEPEVMVTAPGVYGGIYTLSPDDDYEVVYSDNMNVGTGHVTITGKGNFTTGDNPIVLDFTIEPRGINLSNLVAPETIPEGYILDESDVDIEVDGVILVRCNYDGQTGCDYVLEISGDNDGVVGNFVHVAAEGRNNYTGVAVRDIEIVAKLTQTVSFEGGDIEKTYGDAKFTRTATTDGDGAITYVSSNTNVATVDLNSGEVTIVGVGLADIIAIAAETDTYAQASAGYRITVSKKTITVSSVTVSNKTYDGGTTATVTNAALSDDDLLLGDGFSIDEVHFLNANVGDYDDVYVRIALDDDAYELYQFENNSKTAETVGSASITAFTLGADNASAALANEAYTYDGEAKEPTATVTVDLDGDGEKETTLVDGTDYAIDYDNNINAGTATATITGAGNYDGSLPALEFVINPATVSDVMVTAPAQTYTGEALEPVPTVTGTVNGEQVTFTADDYEIEAHEDFVGAGDYNFTIKSKDGSNYNIPATGGSFTIDKAESEEPTNTPSDLAAEVGQTLADLGDLPEGFSWVDDSTVVAPGMNDYQATYTKNGDTDNYETITISIPVLGFTAEYEVVEGAGQEYVIGEDESALFEIDADYELFEEGGEVYVDNELVEPANYESRSGSTIIEFKKEFMDGLALGEHSLAVLFNDGGVARTTFTVKNPVVPEDEPGEDEPAAADTGVFTGINGGAVATGITAVVVATLASVAYVAKRKNN